MQVRLICWGPLLGGTAWQFPPHQSQTFGEPASHMKAVEYVAGVGEMVGDGRLI